MREYIVNKNLRITIPHNLRKNFGISKGTKVYFVEEMDGIKVLPITSRIIERNIGFMKTKF
jgi:AbrB family looped-hinge helix DNA binding protein